MAYTRKPEGDPKRNQSFVTGKTGTKRVWLNAVPEKDIFQVPGSDSVFASVILKDGNTLKRVVFALQKSDVFGSWNKQQNDTDDRKVNLGILISDFPIQGRDQDTGELKSYWDWELTAQYQGK